MQKSGVGLRVRVWMTLVASTLFIAWPAAAEDESPSADLAVQYVDLDGAFIANLGRSEGRPDTGHLAYVKTDVALQVRGSAAHAAVRAHLPAVRNIIVLALSRQDQATINSAAGREALKAEALSEIQALLSAEEGSPHVEDLLFTNFIVQL